MDTSKLHNDMNDYFTKLENFSREYANKIDTIILSKLEHIKNKAREMGELKLHEILSQVKPGLPAEEVIKIHQQIIEADYLLELEYPEPHFDFDDTSDYSYKLVVDPELIKITVSKILIID